MKKPSVALIAGTILILTATGMAWGISLTDYTFPRSTSQQAYVNGVFNAQNESTDSTVVGSSLAGSGSYQLNYRSLPLSYNLDGLASLSTLKSTIKGAPSKSAYNISLHSSADKYLKDSSNFFGYGSAGVDIRKLTSQDSADHTRLDVEAGAGYGRTINATVLKQAIRMNEDFKKYGVITGDIPDKVLLDLASIIDRKSEYQSKYGSVEYRKYWYEDMEKAIRESGVLAGQGLGALGIIRVQEVLDEPTAQRWHGWSVRAGIGARLSDFDGKRGDPRLSTRFDWARPVSLDLQLTNNAAASTVFQTDPVYNLMDAFEVDYELSNRIDWYNTATINYDILTATNAKNILRLDLKSTYIFYIANKLSFNPEFQYHFQDNGVGPNLWNWTVLGSISYRLR